MKKIVIFISIYIVLAVLAYLALSYEKNEKIQNFLDNKTEQYKQNYNVLYNKQKMLSKIIFSTSINTEEVLNIFKDASSASIEEKNNIRKKLLQRFEDTYKQCKQFNIKQLHFHLPNNESFLRFHRPEVYGDDLTDIRETVKYVNENKKPIDGFEEGRIYNGYRFVFPLFYQKKHIGSVEISFSTLALSIEFMDAYNVLTNFLILKSIVKEKVFKDEQKNYINSQIKEFCLEKDVYHYMKKYKNIKTEEALTQETRETISKKAQILDSFSLYDNLRKDVMTYIKVQNPINKKVIGIFVVKSKAEYIKNKTNNFYILFGLVNLFIILVLFYRYKETRYRTYIEQSNIKLQISRQKILSLNLTLEERIKEEVEKNRKKDEHLFHQSRLAQMGEMISMIAHQWRQPLGSISVTSINMKMQIELKKFDLDKKESQESFLKYFEDSLNNIDNFVKNLTTTIDDFRNFYKPNKKAICTSIDTPLKTSLKIIKPTLDVNNIKIIENFDEPIEIEIFINEIVQVFLNIFKNAQDNFVEKGTQDAQITITSKNLKDGVSIEICDNGGGIDEKIINKIFDPYFSTKDEKNGTGLGLYMSKIIIEEHHHGELEVENCNTSTCFRINLKGKIDEK